MPQASGQPNVVTATSPAVRVNESPRELAELSLRFLTDFANSAVPASVCVREFSDSCKGKADELSDISDNRHDLRILSPTLRTKTVDWSPSRTTATVRTFCRFTSQVITSEPVGCSPKDCPLGKTETVEGDCWTTNVYEQGRWWLCTSTSWATRSRALCNVRCSGVPAESSSRRRFRRLPNAGAAIITAMAPRSVLRPLALVALLVGLAALVTYPQVRQIGTGVNDFGDPLLNAWALAWTAHILPVSPASLFDANIFYPERGTLALSETLVFPVFLVAPLRWLGLNPITLHNVTLLAGTRSAV